MIEAGDCILAGVSGGADSVCLLMLLAELREEMGFALEAVHVEHGIRGEESRQDAAFVEDLCRAIQIPLHMIEVDVPAYSEEKGLGTEEAARILRYEAFRKIALQKNAKIALAHHQEDNAETMLFQLARGSSLAGLCGMQPIRKDDGGVTYIRPLLHVHREEVEVFLKEQEQFYRMDSTNAELTYSRNYIRNIILPKFKEVNAQAVQHMNTTAGLLAEVHDFLMQEAEVAWGKAVCVCEEKNGQRGLELDINMIVTLHPALQKEIIYRAIAYMSGGKKDIGLVHVLDILALCSNQSGKQVHLQGGIMVQKEYQTLRFLCKETEYQNEQDIFAKKGNDICVLAEMLKEENTEIPLGENGEKLLISIFPYESKNIKIPQKPYTKWMDYDKIKQGFCVRTRRSGDVFVVDALGHRKKVKQYFIDEKIPASQREKMWLLAQDNMVLWLIGERMSEHVKVTENTKTIIEITYDGGC